MAQGYLIFHLNLAFSSIKAEVRPEVIEKCYWPLLDLAEHTGIPIGIELTGWTLQQIAVCDRSWVERFRQLLENRGCELIGSGWSQLIGPLVPYEVNHWNQVLGLEAYRQTLGVTPGIALVNEMAFSTGMVDVYAEAGYTGLVMDRDNVRLALGLDHAPLSEMPTHALGCGERALPVLWSDSVMFQRLQRVAHGDIPLSEYLSYMTQRANNDQAILPVYCNDAEIFDYRPGRFTAESRMHAEGEWSRLKRVCDRLQVDLGIEWLGPSESLAIQAAAPNPVIRRLNTVSQPIPVKKQAKYNINRWAVTGRDDLWLNTSCHRIYQALRNTDCTDEAAWRELCELWASDLRTHITADRWDEALTRIGEACRRLGIDDSQQQDNEDNGGDGSYHNLNEGPSLNDAQIVVDDEGIFWTITTPTIHLTLNLRRGLTIRSLAFASHRFEPVIGTLPQGFFSTIDLGADFYSGGILIEVPGERSRLTDLEWVTPGIRQRGNELSIRARIPLGQGMLEKTIAIDINHGRLRLSYDFQRFERPLGIVRIGLFTLLPEAFSLPLSVQCINGGQQLESFPLEHEVNHGQAASTLVSSTAAFGATDGRLMIEDAEKRRLTLSWNPADCAAAPMLKHLRAGNSHLTRLWFSLCELDDTVRAGGRLLPFSVELWAE